MLQQLVLNGIVAGSAYSLVALGFALIYRTVRFFHFAHGAIYTIGAFLAYTLVRWFDMHIGAAFFLAMVGSGVIGAGLDRVIYQPLRRERAPNFVLLVVSIGAFILLQNLVQLIYGAEVRTLRVGNVEEGHHILGAVITDVQIDILLVVLLTVAILSLIVQKTKIGKAIRAVSDDAGAASIVGINPEKAILVAVFLGSAIAGLAGALASLETNLQPTMGLDAILKGIVASIVGGIGSIPGAVLGGLLVGIAENLGISAIPSAWKDMISFLFLIGFLLLRPGGILGVRVDRVRV
jgi:branched-chain amino acid transport system permease protein